MVRIISLNINKRKHSLKNIIEWLNKRNADIILLQETTSLRNYDLSIIQNGWGGPIYENKGTKASRGVTTLIKNNLNIDSCKNIKLDKKGRVIKTTIKLDEETYTVKFS